VRSSLGLSEGIGTLTFRIGVICERAENLHIPTIGRNARAQAHMIEDLLAVSAIVRGKLRLEFGRVDLARLVRPAHPGRVQLVVRDTGVGIEPSFLPHVFDRFRQADATTTRTHGGLGLGLSIVKYLVESHGGTVLAESEGRNRGATFTVTLPVRSPADLSSAPQGSESPMSR
jgi:signal transduction histidine kinase